MALFAAGFGLGLGSIAGLSVGPYIFERMLVPKKYSEKVGDAADRDVMAEAPDAGLVVSSEMRQLLPFTENWTTSPDYERVSMINRLLATLWPGLTKAIMVEVIKGVRPALEQQVFKKFAFIEDIVLGTQSMRQQETWDTYIKDKDFTVGSVPPRVGGIKCYDTTDDEVVLEVPLVWGSNLKMNVGVFLRAGPLRLYVPVEVSNLQFKVETRITIKPLVETIPCVGGATVTLLDVPHVDLSLKIIKGVDIMALPIIKDAVRFGLQHVLNGLLIYPNSMSFPIMPNFGVPPPPAGALNIKLLRAENLRKGDDTYVKMEVRKGRPATSQTVSNNKNPEYNEEFHLIIDDFREQRLRLVVYEDDVGWSDTPIAEGSVDFAEVLSSVQDPVTGKYVDEVKLADFIKNPMHEQLIAVPLTKPYEEFQALGTSMKSMIRLGSSASKVLSKKEKKKKTSGNGAPEGEGTLYVKLTFLPFLQPTFDDEEDDAATQAKRKAKRAAPPRPASRVVTHDISSHRKGLLTVNLIRCINLVGTSPNTYVRLLTSDEDSSHDQTYKSTTVFNENSPRWGTKFDFVMITMGSTLYVTVYNKASASSSLLKNVNFFSKKGESADIVLGRLAIPVQDVVRNGTLKDKFVLGDAVRGEIELALSWQTCEVPNN